jgi:hypothetical protein
MARKFPRTGITNWVHLEKLKVPERVKNFPVFYGARTFISRFKRKSYFSLS